MGRKMRETIEIDLPADFIRKVEELKNFYGLASNAELLYYAVNLLNNITEERKKGNKIKMLPFSGYPISGSTSTIKGEIRRG